MRDKLNGFAQKFPALFWLAVGIVFYFLYRLPSVGFAGENLLAQTLLFVVLSLAVAVFMVWLFGEWNFGLTEGNPLSGIALGIFLFLPLITEFLTMLCVDPIRGERLGALALYSFSRGMFESLLFFSLLTTHMMRSWNGKEFRGLASSLTVGFVSCIVCLGDIFVGKTGAEVMIGAITTFALVSALAAVYIRTRNLWPCVVIMGLHYFANGFYTIYQMEENGMLHHAISSPALLQFVTIATSLCFVLVGIGITFYYEYLLVDEGEEERWPEARWDPIPELVMDDEPLLGRKKRKESGDGDAMAEETAEDAPEEAAAEETDTEEAVREEAMTDDTEMMDPEGEAAAETETKKSSRSWSW